MREGVHQLTLSFEPGLAAQHRTLKDCVAAGVYQRGVVNVAGRIDRQPSHLSEALSGGDRRKFDVDDLEAYIREFNDTTPILYLAAKYLRDPAVTQQEALSKLASLAELLPGLMAAAGLDPAGVAGGKRRVR